MLLPVNALSKLGRRTSEPPISWLMKQALQRPGLISLAAGFTDNPTLPVRETGAIVEGLLRGKKGQPHLQYGTTPGDTRLRQLTAARLAHLDNRSAKTAAYASDRLLITHGSQQLLYILSEILFDPGDLVLVEDPSYFVYLGIMQSHGIRGRGIRLEADGIDLAYLEATLNQLQQAGELPRLKALYLVSYHSNPAGITTSATKKAAALKLLRRYEKAAGHPIYLIEDAAYRELRFAGEDTPSALSLDLRADRVVYTSTFSKPFATGVRVGFGLLPEPLLTAALRVKGNHDFGTANFLQQILTQALANDSYETQVAKLRRRYARKAKAMTQACAAHFPDAVQWANPTGGLYVWARLPAKVRSGLKSALFEAAIRHKVLYVPGSLCYCDDTTRRKPNRELRLSYGNASLKEIEEGIARLGRALKKVL